jgi:zinc finger protein 830
MFGKLHASWVLLFLHREYRQRVDMLKKQLIESKAARTAKANSKPVGMDTESSSDSSSDEEDNTDFAVDWRAQHLK